MRASLMMAALVAALAMASSAVADELATQSLSDYSLGGCDSCGHGHRLHGRLGCKGCGHLGKRKNIDGLDRGFNCGCTGSYKYPVPPQYTYFWPGSVYSMELMTNYHSPWRFPPLKPYTEEVLVPAATELESDLQPVSATEVIAEPKLRPGQLEPMSSAMQRFFR